MSRFCPLEQRGRAVTKEVQAPLEIAARVLEFLFWMAKDLG